MELPLKSRVHSLLEKFGEVAASARSAQTLLIYFPTATDDDAQKFAALTNACFDVANALHYMEDVQDGKVFNFKRYKTYVPANERRRLEKALSEMDPTAIERTIEKMGYDDSHTPPLGPLITVAIQDLQQLFEDHKKNKGIE